MILSKLFGSRLEHRILRYVYRHRKRNVSVEEISLVFSLKPDESLRTLRQMQEDMMLKEVEGNIYVFGLSKELKSELRRLRTVLIFLAALLFIFIYAVIMNARATR